MCKKSDTTAILLQPGDSISIGRSSETPWMEFYVTRIPVPVTPDCEDIKNVNISKVKTPPPKSKRRLYYTYPSSQSSSGQQLFFDDSQQDDNMFTQNMTARDGNDEGQLAESRTEIKRRGTKRKNLTMSPRKLLNVQDNDRRATAAKKTVSRVTNKAQKGDSQRTVQTESWYESDSLETANDWLTKREAMDSSISDETQNDGAIGKALATRKKKRVRKEASQTIVPSTGQSQESSVLSLPQCPTWDDDEEVSSKHIQRDTARHGQSSLHSRGMNHQMAAGFKSAGSQASNTDAKQEQEEDSPIITFASALSLSQWKDVQRAESNTETGRVRKALASLVVAQRTRDSTWFPAILEGSIVEDV